MMGMMPTINHPTHAKLALRSPSLPVVMWVFLTYIRFAATQCHRISTRPDSMAFKLQ